jgi:hypothetical protein
MMHTGESKTLVVSSKARASKYYRFDAAKKRINVDDADYMMLLGVVNLTIGETIYNPMDPSKQGRVFGSELTFATTNDRMEDSDELYILYEPDSEDNMVNEDILDRLEEVLELLKGLCSG